jgi:hypothetical protein
MHYLTAAARASVIEVIVRLVKRHRNLSASGQRGANVPSPLMKHGAGMGTMRHQFDGSVFSSSLDAQTCAKFTHLQSA